MSLLSLATRKRRTQRIRNKAEVRRRRLRVELLETRRVLAAVPYGAEPISTNEYMLGDIYVSVVLLESNGAIDPVIGTWTPEMVDLEKEKVTQGLAWWENMLELQGSNHDLNFQIDFTFADEPFLTSYEPSSRPVDERNLWAQEFLTSQGFDRHTSWIANLQEFNHSRRVENEAHWAFTYFIINVTGNEDWNRGRAHGSSNGWGLQSNLRAASTVAHEIAHIFYALDEYPGFRSYNDSRGYYDTQNLNAFDDHPDPGSRVVSIMDRSGTGFANNAASPSALAMMGWQDSDGNGIFDVLDVPLVLEGVGGFDAQTNTFQFSGESWVQTLPNLNPSGPGNDITINTVSQVQYRLDGGSWINVAAPGGYRTQFDVTIGPLIGNNHEIEIRTLADESGVTSNYFVANTRFPSGIGAPGISGFAWFDANDNAQWDAYESGLEDIKIVVRDLDGEVASRRFVMEPDDFKHRQWINEIHPDVTMTAIGSEVDGRVHAFDSVGSTGQRVFAHRLLNNGWNTTWNVNRQLRADFKQPVQRVSIDVISPFNGAEVVMQAFSADNQLLGSVKSGRLNSGEMETLSISLSSADIDHVVIGGVAGRSSFRLDNLVFSVDAFSFTDQFGFYSIENLEPATYIVSAEHPLAATPVSPLSGQHQIELAADQRSGGVHFGFDEESGPWAPPDTTPNLGGIRVEFRGGRGQAIEAPHYGERIFLQVSWEERSIAADEQYIVRAWVNDIPLDSEVFSGSGNITANRSASFEGWYASQGTSAIRVELDPVGSIEELVLDDNLLEYNFETLAPASLPERLIWPVSGVYNQDWQIMMYVDIDPRVGERSGYDPKLRSDYLGGWFQYDQHQGIDIVVPNYTLMDAGIPIYAAASGVVRTVNDGDYDRGSRGDVRLGNYIFLDHGNGWGTSYGHLARDSITVSEGDTVYSGQVIALMGSSKTDTPHLHFGVYKDNASVEPFLAPDAYWKEPLPYQGSLLPGVLYSAVTNYLSSRNGDNRDAREAIVTVDRFPSDYSDPVYVYYSLTHGIADAPIQLKVLRPDGSTARIRDYIYGRTEPFGCCARWGFLESWSQHPGEWQIVYLQSGIELIRHSILIGESLEPSIRVSDGVNSFAGGRTTPIEFAGSGDSAQLQMEFTIENYGYDEANIFQIEVPAGFRLISLPEAIAPGEESTFSIAVDTSQMGYRIGEVRLHTNDPKSPVFTFVVEGEVGGEVPDDTPEIALPSNALYYELGTTAKPIATGAIISTSEPGGGVLQVQMVAGGKLGDQIVLSGQWGDPERIATNGDEVFFQGERVARFTEGFDNVPAVITFDANASLVAVEATLRAVSYRNGRGADGQSIRRVGYTFTDGQGKKSLPAYRAIVTSQNDSILLGNARPTQIELTVADFDPALSGAVIGQINVSDPDDDQHVIAVGDERLEIVNGVLRLKVGQQFVKGLETQLLVQITASDPGQLSLTESFLVPVRFNRPPKFSVPNSLSWDEAWQEPVVFENVVSQIMPSSLASLQDEAGQNVQLVVAPLNVPAGLMAGSPTINPSSLSGPWPSDASLTFYPATHAFGSAVYEITATDDDAVDPRSTTQLLTVTIQPVNDPPVAFDRLLIVDEAVEADGQTATLAFTAADLIAGRTGETPSRAADVPASVPLQFNESEQTLKVVAFAIPGQTKVDVANLPGGAGTVTRVLPSGGTVRFVFSGGAFVSGTYTPPIDFNLNPLFGGLDTFSYIVEDDGKTTIPGPGGGVVYLPRERSGPASVTLRVLPANDPPLIPEFSNLPVRLDETKTSASQFVQLFGDSDAKILPGPITALDELAEQTVTVQLIAVDIPGGNTPGPNSLMAAAPTVDADGQLTLSLNAHAFGVAVYDLIATDDHPSDPRSSTKRLTITVDPVNDPPVGFERTFEVQEAVEADGEVATLVFTAAVLLTGRAGETAARASDLPIGVPAIFDESEQTLKVVAFEVDGQPFVDVADLSGGFGTVSRTLASGGLIEFVFADGAFVSGTYTPPIDFNESPLFGGLDQFTYIVEDDGKSTIPGAASSPIFLPAARSQPAIVSLRVLATNDPPQFESLAEVVIAEVSALETISVPGWATNIHPGPATAIDEWYTQEVVFSFVSELSTIPKGLFHSQPIVLSSGDLQLFPSPHANGMAILVIQATDVIKQGMEVPSGFVSRSSSATVTVTIEPVNDAPQFKPGPDIIIGDNREPFVQVWATEILPGPPEAIDEHTTQTVEFELVIDGNSFGLFAQGGLPTMDAQGVLRFVPHPSNHGQTTIVVTAIDSAGGRSESFELSITLENVHAAPVLDDLLTGTYWGRSLVVDLLPQSISSAVAIDANSITLETEPAHGSLTVLGDGRIQYDAEAGFVGDDAIEVTVRDVDGRVSNRAMVTIRVVASPAQNPLVMGDVDDDGLVQPLDALLVLTRLARAGREGVVGGLLADSVADEIPLHYYDVDGNGRIEPLDALMILTEIARKNRSGNSEGESRFDEPMTARAVAVAPPSVRENSSDIESPDDFLRSLFFLDSTDKTTDNLISFDLLEVELNVISPALAGTRDEQPDDTEARELADAVWGQWRSL